MSTGDIRRMRLRRDGVCGCGASVPAGALGGWDRVRRVVLCLECLGTDQSPAIPAVDDNALAARASVGVAGGSAQAEYERRVAKREARVRSAHPRIGGFLLKVTNEPQSTRAWASGAAGERYVAARLAELAGDDVVFLHDRRIPRSRANIDHIAIGPAGVYVIDAKRYNNAKVAVRRSGGLLRPVTEQLFVGGRDRTKLVDGLAPQVAAVRVALDGLGIEVPVSSLLCFVDALLPIFGSLQMGEVPIVGPKGAAAVIRRSGPLDAERRERVRAHLVSRLRPAT